MLPALFQAWFDGRGWMPRPHQLAVADAAAQGRSVLLVAPTGGGKTLAGFLPSLIDLAATPPAERGGLHTLYISPLKALAVDVLRNLEMPVAEMGLPIRIETRTGDTPAAKRGRQRTDPPDMLLTTPEQLALMLSYPDADRIFGGLKAIVLDELHALTPSKRGDLLALGLARLARLAPDARRVGLSATVHDPPALARWLVPQREGQAPALLVEGERGADPQVQILASEAHIPWSGHSARHAMAEVYDAIKANQCVLVFVNTRSQAEVAFQELWRINDDNLPIALHHGSLAVEQRRKVEEAMSAGRLRAVVCTSTLDLGIDWAGVDLVVQLGAPKGASRLVQRIGRANHRLNEPSRALLVPANRFEVLECRAAAEALSAHTLDHEIERTGALDVLAQHILGTACSGPFAIGTLYAEVTTALPYHHLTADVFSRVVDFVRNGGYALQNYDRWRRLAPLSNGQLRLAHPQIAQRYRMNVGTIIEEPMLKVRLVKPGRRAQMGGRFLGEIEEYFIEQLAPGDTFLFAGEILRLEGIAETDAFVSRATGKEPKIPAYAGGKFPLSTHLAARVRAMLADPKSWGRLPAPVAEWLRLQAWRSVLPAQDQMLVETFPRGGKFYLVAYPFEGRLAHQTLGMLLTRRLERANLRPLGFVASDYAIAVWAQADLGGVDPAWLFHEDLMGEDLEEWMAESSLLKRTFRNCAIIAGLIDRRLPGHEKNGRQVTMSTDLIYDVLRRHEPDHILLKATWGDAATGLLDIGRLGQMLARIKGHILHQKLERVSPLAVPVMLEIGKVPVGGDAAEWVLAEAEDELIAEATRLI